MPMVRQARSTKPTRNETAAAPDHRKPWDPNSLLYAVSVTGAFLVVALFGIVHHEMWRDEHQAWLVARDAPSLAGLFENLKYEGNPGLWHLGLFVISRLTSNPVYMQALHVLIACGFIFVFNRYCGLGVVHRLLFTFGYLGAYEYAVISRGYGLGLLLTFVACALYKRRSSHYFLLPLLLGLLANVTVYGLIISLGIAGTLLADYFLHRSRGEKLPAALLAGAGAYLVLLFAALYQIIPSKDNTFPVQYARTWFDSERWAYVSSRLFTSYFYVPDPRSLHFWGTNAFFHDAMKADAPPHVWQLVAHNPAMGLVFVVMPVVLFLMGLIVFLRKPLVLLLYAAVTATLLAVYYYTLLVQMRYCGHLLVVLVSCFWLADYYPEHAFRNGLLARLGGVGRWVGKPLLTVILAAQVIGALVAYRKDYQFKFSVSKDAADFIRQKGLASLEMAGLTDFIVSPLASYLDTKIFYLQRMEFGSFIKWDRQRREELSSRELLRAIAQPMQEGRTQLLLITSNPIIVGSGENQIRSANHFLLSSDTKVDLLQAFRAGIVEDEKYGIYLVQRVDPTKEDLSGYTVLRIQ
jgi:hypothetical protein